ncbi:MAG: cytochrome c family protein [Rhizobiales bacterium]|nr:cytochrome c family protein [Hyphomicrobiales bacterium]
MKSSIILASLAAIVFSVSAQAAEPDVEKGEKVFRKCKACHEVNKEKNKVGPHLINLIGRKAGALEGYKFSKAMVAKGADDGLVWTEEVLLEYLIKPKDYVKGTKMAFAGLKKEEDRVNLVAYLKTFSKADQ